MLKPPFLWNCFEPKGNPSADYTPYAGLAITLWLFLRFTGQVFLPQFRIPLKNDPNLEISNGLPKDSVTFPLRLSFPSANLDHLFLYHCSQEYSKEHPQTVCHISVSHLKSLFPRQCDLSLINLWKEINFTHTFVLRGPNEITNMKSLNTVRKIHFFNAHIYYQILDSYLQKFKGSYTEERDTCYFVQWEEILTMSKFSGTQQCLVLRWHSVNASNIGERWEIECKINLMFTFSVYHCSCRIHWVVTITI